MDRALIEEHLALAIEHVARGRAVLERQRRLIAELERDGHDISQAQARLSEFQAVQKVHIGDRDRLARELSQRIE